jgi:outer membrane protein insertion porin family
VPFDYGSGGEYEIAAIRVEGAKFLDAKILATLSGLAVGDKIKVPGEAIPKAIKTLWRQRLFTDITIHAEKIEAGKDALGDLRGRAPSRVALLVERIEKWRIGRITQKTGFASRTDFHGKSCAASPSIHVKTILQRKDFWPQM